MNLFQLKVRKVELIGKIKDKKIFEERKVNMRTLETQKRWLTPDKSKEFLFG